MRLISPEMLDKARARVRALAVPNVEFAEGRAEAIPAASDSLDTVLAALILMSVIKGIGPGARADPNSFVSQLEAAGLEARWENETTNFRFGKFQDAWDALAGVTTAALGPDIQEPANAAVRERIWSDAGSPQEFRNGTRFIAAEKPAIRTRTKRATQCVPNP